MSTVLLANYSIQISGMVLCLLSILLLVMERRIDKRHSRFFITYLSILFALILFGMLYHLGQGKPGAGWHLYTWGALYLYLILASLQAYFLSMFFLDAVDWEKRLRPFQILFTAITGFQLVVLTFSLWNGLVFSVDGSNIVHRGPWNAPVTSLSSLLVILDLMILLCCRKRVSPHLFRDLFLYFSIPIIGMVLQILFPKVHILLGSLILATVIVFISFVKRETMEYYEQEQEYERTKTALMLSQIQPHFLYNSLGVIQELCHSDPKKAEEATMIFSQFLRRNMDSLTMDRPIPFEEELEHTKNYLELEKMRFGDQLRIEYDIHTTDFLIPTLTLQPLVENAVRHGIRQKEDGGTVVISTRDFPDRTEVRVQDDGPGVPPESFLTLTETGRIGIKNVSERLNKISNGSLTLDFRPGTGVFCVITLPKKEVH